jgi:NAD(P)-dependent dehydrogenase (short-subunit alcohol dehydrogenase family)
MSINNLFNVAGKSVLVTGGGRGIGKMIAEGFVANGSTVYISSRDQNALESTADELNSNNNNNNNNGKCIPIVGNLNSREGCEELALSIEKHSPLGLNVLVNNSGTSWGESLERKSGKMNWGWDRVLDLNLKAPFYLTRALIPLMRQASLPHDPSRVIMIGSVVGITHQDFPTHAYDASKAALHSLTKKLAYDLAQPPQQPNEGIIQEEDGSGRITVNAIAPGYFPSKMTQGLAAWGVSQENTSKSIPLGRIGIGADIAGAAIYMASPCAAWLSGAVLPVDGGLLTAPIHIGDEQD